MAVPAMLAAGGHAGLRHARRGAQDGCRPVSPFATTRWSIILDARSGAEPARLALEEIYRAYRSPVLAYVRRSGRGDLEAEDLVQEFFTRLLERRWDVRADPARGRFRTYMLTALQRFLLDAGDAARARKRGGDLRRVDADEALASLHGSDSPERAFEQAWAITVIERAFAQLHKEALGAGRGPLFEALAPYIVETADAAEYASVGAQLGMRANTVAVAVHRLRKRLRELVRNELADQADGPGAVDDELRVLHAALSDQPKGNRDAA